MNTRRSFFRKIAAVIAAIAIAPEIAFRKKLELPVVTQGPHEYAIYCDGKLVEALWYETRLTPEQNEELTRHLLEQWGPWAP